MLVCETAWFFCSEADRWLEGNLVGSLRDGRDGLVTIQCQHAGQKVVKRVHSLAVAQPTPASLKMPDDLLVLTQLTSPLSSINVERIETSMGAFLCASLCKALGAQCAFINSSFFRAEKDYPAGAMTYGDLAMELPKDTSLVVLDLPGIIIKDMYEYATSQAITLQVDMRMQTGHGTVLEIAGHPLSENEVYRTVLSYDAAFNGLDDNRPLVSYVKECIAIPAMEGFQAARPAKHVLFCFFNGSSVVRSVNAREMLRSGPQPVVKEGTSYDEVERLCNSAAQAAQACPLSSLLACSLPARRSVCDACPEAPAHPTVPYGPTGILRLERFCDE